jgi:hypothetical protein
MVMPIFQIDTMEYPCIGIRDESQPGEGYLSRPLLEERDAAYTLFDGAEGEHTISVIKLSENSRGKSGLMELETDGEFLPPEEVKPSLYIEVVGDSISCGYGNESTEPGFRTQEENGERAYGALAAKELKADYSCIAVSGCSVAAPTWLPGLTIQWAWKICIVTPTACWKRSLAGVNTHSGISRLSLWMQWLLISAQTMPPKLK